MFFFKPVQSGDDTQGPYTIIQHKDCGRKFRFSILHTGRRLIAKVCYVYELDPETGKYEFFKEYRVKKYDVTEAERIARKFDKEFGPQFCSHNSRLLDDYKESIKEKRTATRKRNQAIKETARAEEAVAPRERVLKMMITASGGTASKAGKTYRINIPTSWAIQMGITPESREMKATFQNGKIILEKC